MVALLDALEIERTAGRRLVDGRLRRPVAGPQRARSGSRALGLISTHTGGPDCVNGEPEVARELVDHSGTPREQATRLISLLFPPDRRRRKPTSASASSSPPPARRSPSGCSSCRRKRSATGTAGRSSLPVLDPAGPDRDRPRRRRHRGAARQRRGARPLPSRRDGGRSVPACAHAPMAQEPEAVAAAILAASAVIRLGRAPLRRRLEGRLIYDAGRSALAGSEGPPATRSKIPTAAMPTPAYCRDTDDARLFDRATSSPRRSRT